MRTIEWWVKSEGILPYICDGSKPLEARPNWGKASRINAGQVLLINRSVHRRVVEIRRYDTFMLALQHENFRHIWPPAETPLEVFRLWRSLYSEYDERKGVLIFQLERV